MVREVDILALPSIKAAFFPITKYVARSARQANANLVIITGGAHVSYRDFESIREAPELDIIIRGEGENTFSEVLDHLDNLNAVSGITFQKLSDVQRNDDAPLMPGDQIPTPDYTILPFPLSQYSVRPQVSRGCPWRCDFCQDGFYWNRVRYFDIKKILQELETIAMLQGRGTHVHFIDSIFTLNHKYVNALLNEIISQNLGLEFSGDVRAGTLTPGLLKLMEQAGFTRILFGVEEGDREILDTVNKELTPEDNLSDLRMVREYTSMFITAYYVLGLPGATPRTCEASLNFASMLLYENLVDDISDGLFVPYPGTPPFENPEAFGIKVRKGKWGEFMRVTSNPVVSTATMSSDELAGFLMRFDRWLCLEYCRKVGITLAELKEKPTISDEYKFPLLDLRYYMIRTGETNICLSAKQDSRRPRNYMH